MSKVMEKELNWNAELVFLPKTLTERANELYFDEMYPTMKKLIETEGNKNKLYSRKLNFHTLIMIKEAALDDEFKASLEEMNKALYDWDLKLTVSVDGKEVPFCLLNYDTKENIITDILENGKSQGISKDVFKVFEHREGLYVDNQFRMDLTENEDNSYSYMIYSEYEEYQGRCGNPSNKPFYEIAGEIISDFKNIVLPALDDLLERQNTPSGKTPIRVNLDEIEF